MMIDLFLLLERTEIKLIIASPNTRTPIEMKKIVLMVAIAPLQVQKAAAQQGADLVWILYVQ